MHLSTWRAALYCGLLVIVGCAPRGAGSADVGTRTDAVGVVDAFLSARAVPDWQRVTSYFDDTATIIDLSTGDTASVGALPALLPPGEQVQAGPRHVNELGAVTWTEDVTWHPPASNAPVVADDITSVKLFV